MELNTLVPFRIKELLDHLMLPLYFALGRRAWSLGYYTFKKRSISAAIDNVSRSRERLTILPAGYGSKIDERVVEYPWVFSRIPENPGQRVLDAGSVLNYEFLVSKNLIAQSELTICTLSPEKRNYCNAGVSYVFGDLRDTYFANSAFDVIISISTIEHIGLDNTKFHQKKSISRESKDGSYLDAVKEYKRVLRSGGKCFVTVPFGKRFIGEWYQIFDLEMIMGIIGTFEPETFELCFYGYISNEWVRCEPDDLADADFFDVALSATEAPDGAAGSRGIACLELVK